VIGALLVLTVVGLFEAFRIADVGTLQRFAIAQSSSDPVCSDARVRSSLERSLYRHPNAMRVAAQDVIRASFAGRADIQNWSHSRFAITTLVGREWMVRNMPEDELVQAFCAAGRVGRMYNFGGVARIVGVSNVAQADDDTIQALADVYVNDLLWRVPPDRLRRLYHARLVIVQRGREPAEPASRSN
jgi:hypothetical protein